MPIRKYLVTVSGATHYVTVKRASELEIQEMENDSRYRKLTPEEMEYYYGTAA